MVNAGKADLVASSEALETLKVGGSSFLASSLGFSSFFSSGCFSLVRFSTGAVDWDTPNGIAPPVDAPNEKAGLLLAAAPKDTTGFTGSVLFVLSALGIACIVVLPNPKTTGFETGSRFSLSLEEVVELTATGLIVVFPNSVVSFVMTASFGAEICPNGCAVGCPKLNTDGGAVLPEVPNTAGAGLATVIVVEVGPAAANPIPLCEVAVGCCTALAPKLGMLEALGSSNTFGGSATGGFVGAGTATG